MVVRASRNAEGFAGFDGRDLQPIDADRLLVADLVLEMDVDILAALDHLLGRLRETRLVAVDRRNLKEAGQEGEQRKDDQQSGRAPVRGHRPVDDARETARRGKRLAGLIIGGGTHGLAGVQRFNSARWARTIGPSLRGCHIDVIAGGP